MDLPAQLKPDSKQRVCLPNGTSVQLPKCAPKFRRWSEPPVSFTFGNKPILNHEGEAVFAELAILRLLYKQGWEGAWVEAYGGGNECIYLQRMPTAPPKKLHSVPLPIDKGELLARIRETAGTKSCFDVFVWKADAILFCEAKNAGKDRLRKPQLRFIQAALDCGVPSSALLIVEWSWAERISN